jgi:hypothetical protein
MPGQGRGVKMEMRKEVVEILTLSISVVNFMR